MRFQTRRKQGRRSTRKQRGGAVNSPGNLLIKQLLLEIAEEYKSTAITTNPITKEAITDPIQFIYTKEQLVAMNNQLEKTLTGLLGGRRNQRGGGGSGSGSGSGSSSSSSNSPPVLEKASLSVVLALAVDFADKSTSGLRELLDGLASSGSIMGSVAGGVEYATGNDNSTSTAVLCFAFGCKVASVGITVVRQIMGANKPNAGKLASEAVAAISYSGVHPNMVGPSWAATGVIMAPKIITLRSLLYP
jgi:hypothetical protein